MKIAFLGLGKMGSAIASRFVSPDHTLVVWNRTASATEQLASHGAKVAPTVAEAAREADVVFTMLNDDAAVESVTLGKDGLLAALRPGAIHVSLSTISVALSRRLTTEHSRANSEFVAAPVFGRPNVAAEGKLWIVVAGKPSAVAKVHPLLKKASRGLTIISGEPWSAHALKIGGNFLITAMIESLSEAMVFAESEGIDPALFLETVNTALFRSPFYAAYGKVMLNPPAQPGATITLGAKDMRLFREGAQQAGTQTPLADHFASDLAAAAEAGLADQDWAAGLYQFAKNKNTRQPA